MPLQTDIGKVAAAIESGRRAASSVDYGPIRTLDVIKSDQLNRFPADWHLMPDNPNIFLFGLDKWGDEDQRVTK